MMSNTFSDHRVGAIILAAGKGKRMQSQKTNKVVFLIGGRPMVGHAAALLKKANIATIVVVVGFAKQSVIEALQGEDIFFAEQSKRLGTGHAASCGLKKMPKTITDVLIVQGDDSAFYTPETLRKLLSSHFRSRAELTFLTIELPNPSGLGRIVRDKAGKVSAVVEEKDATDEQKFIREVNPACYVFRIDFLKKYINTIKKSAVTGEYYLTSLIDIAIRHNKKIETVRGGALPWRGVNTREELEEAQRLYRSTKTLYGETVI